VDAIRTVHRKAWKGDAFAEGERTIAEEAAVAFVYDGTSYAVMMATPKDLEDFAVGLTLTEGIVASPDEIESLEVLEEEIGIELRMRLAVERARALTERRRFLTGPVGCGLCGIDSLAEAMRPVKPVGTGIATTPDVILAALDQMGDGQALNRATRAVHAAAFADRKGTVVAVREDVGRHNALDKLVGALARAGTRARDGFLLVTSRLSVELVQKASMTGATILVAVSAPTALALRAAETAGITLVAVARRDGFEVFTHPERIRSAAGSGAAAVGKGKAGARADGGR
jgi:FdhD protein